MKHNKKSLVLNGILPFVDQVLRLVIGLVVSKLVLEGFGSEYNGLISSTANLIMYLALLEAGISTTTRVALFKAIGNGDNEEVGHIFSSARYYYRRVAYIYVLAVFILGFIYPLVVKSDIDYWIVFGVLVIQGISSALGFAFNINATQLFVADGKSYISNLTTMLVHLLCNIGKVIAVLVFDNIFVMLSFNLLVTILQTIIYQVVLRKKYSFIKITKEYNKSLLPDRGPYMIMQLGYLLFNATDTVVLSIFCGFEVASIYAVYMIVYTAIKQVSSMMRSNFKYTIGQAYYSAKDKFGDIYDVYQNSINTIVTVLLAVSYILVLPFIALYTKNVHDVNYINKILPIFFTINMLLDDWWSPGSTLMNISGKAKQLSICICIIGGINIILSISLVSFLGIEGVLLATMIAAFIKNVYVAIMSNRKELNRSSFHDVMRNSGNLILLAVVMATTEFIDLKITNFGQFFIWALIITPIVFVAFVLVNYLINYKLYSPIVKRLFAKSRNKKIKMNK